MSLPRTVTGLVARLRQIDASLPASDGVAVFTHMYLTVSERIATDLGHPEGADTVDDIRFENVKTMSNLDVRFANLWLAAYDAAAGAGSVPVVWQPLFAARSGGRLPIQYALAGMNAHIEHDLPVAVVGTCQALHLAPGNLQADYDAINDVLADVEAQIRQSFLDRAEQEMDAPVEPVVHLISSWSIDRARQLAWVTAETLWALREMPDLQQRVLEGVEHTVGMTSRLLLTPLP